MRTYTTIQGDTWDIIAYRVYGTSFVMSQLMQANPDYMKIGVFSAGTVLKMPDIDTTEANEELPPWFK
ncbi:tail protein X [Lysinibacillus telephonicus]|uniref:tail protein X n=1 Tax=Lysinibacillus telephonicus TaxID=1714840 RepID=UPI003BA3AA1A